MICTLFSYIAAAPLALALQDVDEAAVRRLRAEHERTVGAERSLALLEAWIAADEPGRAAARDLLAAARPKRGPVVAPPSVRAVVDAWRELSGGGMQGPLPAALVEDQRGLQSLADSIDLTLAPGAFGAGEADDGEARGEAVVVHVRSLFKPTSWADVELALIWLGPDGGELVARREPVETPAFVDGFQMYVRAPTSAPGMWQLVPEVARDGRSARGVGTAAECVADLAARTERALSTEDRSEADGLMRTLLTALLWHGARGSVALAPSQVLDLLERSADAPPPPRPVEPAFVERDGWQRWVWSWRPEAGALERAIVLLAPQGEPADLVLAGTVGRRWRELAEEQRALLLSSELPPTGADRTLAEHMTHLAALARQGGVPADGELILVARGDAAQRASVFPPGRLPFDAAVLSTVVRGDPTQFMPGLPRLVITPGGPDALPPDGVSELVVVAGMGETLLNDPGLPALVAAWIARR